MLTDAEQRQLVRDARWIANRSRIPAFAGVGCLALIVGSFFFLTVIAVLIRFLHAIGHVFGG